MRMRFEYINRAVSPNSIPIYTLSVVEERNKELREQAMSGNERASAIRAFDESKTGVKGLVDAKLTTIPQFFIHPNLEPNPDPNKISPSPKIPMIDLQGAREKIVSEILLASETFGFFQVVNHGIPEAVLGEMMEAVRSFNEQPDEVKREYYTRDKERKVIYNSNFDLYNSLAANWRDTFSCIMAPQSPSPEELPIAFRDVIIKYTSHMQRLATKLFELLSESLGLNHSHLNDMDCDKGVGFAGHYYPPCPEPHLTLGTSKHSDPDFLTILLQDQIGGLQVLHQNQWIDVAPLPGALVINIGDLLQLVSNDKLKSVEHRVLANKVGPRISTGCFFRPNQFSPLRSYGPIKELLSNDDQPIYKEILVQDYIAYFQSRGLDGKSAMNYFMI